MVIVHQLEVGNFAVFSYIVACEQSGEGVVIDPAAEADRIIDTARSKGIARIKYIINTHSHADHAGGNKRLKDKTGAQILVHQDDAFNLANPAGYVLQIFGCEASPPADKTVTDGELIEFGRESLKVIHVPGHTPGGIALYTPGYVFTGDVLFVGGVGRTDLPGGSVRTLLNAIRSKLLTLPQDTVVFPGHNYGPSPQSTIGEEKRTNPFLN